MTQGPKSEHITRRVYSGRVIDLEICEVILPNGVATRLELIRHPGGAAVVALDARLPMDQQLPIIISGVAEMRGVHSRVRIGSEISRRDMPQLALMSSENRAAASLAHHYVCTLLRREQLIHFMIIILG